MRQRKNFVQFLDVAEGGAGSRAQCYVVIDQGSIVADESTGFQVGLKRWGTAVGRVRDYLKNLGLRRARYANVKRPMIVDRRFRPALF